MVSHAAHVEQQRYRPSVRGAEGEQPNTGEARGEEWKMYVQTSSIQLTSTSQQALLPASRPAAREMLEWSEALYAAAALLYGDGVEQPHTATQPASQPAACLQAPQRCCRTLHRAHSTLLLSFHISLSSSGSLYHCQLDCVWHDGRGCVLSQRLTLVSM